MAGGNINRLTASRQWSLAAGRLFNSVRDTLYPPACVSCGQVGSRWCPTCRESVQHATPPWCPTCGYPMPNSASARCWACVHLTHLDQLRAVALHGQGIAPAIHALKYGGDPSLAVELGQLMAEHWPFDTTPPDLVVIPVPLGRRRRWERGYNQAERLARQLALAINRPLAAEALIRSRHTRPQVGLGLADRQANMVDAFAIGSGPALAQRTVLLIDDVCTTGSTLDACAATLKAANVAQVWAYTLSRAVRADHPA